MPSLRMCGFLLAISAAYAITGPEPARGQGKPPTEVVNPSGQSLSVQGGVSVSNFPSSQTVDGTVDVGNFPSSQTVNGTVGVNNFPTSQTVNGAVDVNNFPASQAVTGTVNVGNVVAVQPLEGLSHLGVPIEDHFRATVNGTTPLLQFGRVEFGESFIGGGTEQLAVAEGECLVVLDIELTFEAIEEFGSGGIADVPWGVAEFEYGLFDPATESFFGFGALTAIANEGAIGRLERNFGAGLVIRRTGFLSAADQFVLFSNAITVNGSEVAPLVRGGHVTGYRIPC